MKKAYKLIRYSYQAILMLCLTLALPNIASAQSKAKVSNVNITMSVVDEQDQPVVGAAITIGEGRIHAVSGADGTFTFSAKPSYTVTVEMPGYNVYRSYVSPLAKDPYVVLKPAKFKMSDDDIVSVPFGQTHQRYTTDNVSTLTTKDIEKYPTSDLRNALVGLFPGFASTEKDGQPGLSAEETTGKYGITEKVSESVRGSGLTYFIDDIQIDITEMPLDPNEIESITLVKDPVSKALYGPGATNGVVYIKTKRGQLNERKIKVDFEYGLSVVDRFPEYVNGVDYAIMNNRARNNDASGKYFGLYSDDDIKEYAKGNPYDMLHPNVNYRDLMFKNTREFQRANVSSYGGNENARYFAYIGYTGEGDIYALGSTANYNRINVRSNIDMKLNDFMKMRFDFAGNVNIRKSPNVKNDAAADQENIQEFGTVISGANTTPAIEFPIYTGVNEDTGLYNYGTSDRYAYNPIGGLEGNGFYTELNRSGAGNIALDIDLRQLVKGLTSTTYVGFNGSYLTRVGKNLDYGRYKIIPIDEATNPSDEDIENGYQLQQVAAGTTTSTLAKLHDYYSVRYTGYERLNYERRFGDHYVNSGLVLYLNQLIRDGYKEPIRQANGVFNATYSYKDKYVFQGVVNYSGSNYYAKQNRYKAFPTVGAAWVVSDEQFMQDVDFVDYFKVRAQAGRLGVWKYSPSAYYYDSDWNYGSTNLFGPAGSGANMDWLLSNTTTQHTSSTQARTGNPDLDWEYRDEYTAGFEAYMLDRRLMVDFAYYNRTHCGIIEAVNNLYPSYCGIFNLPYVNFGKKNYWGYELALSFSDKVGDFSYTVGANATINRGSTLIYDEPVYPDNESYRFKEGDALGSQYGLVYLGRYESDEAAQNDPIRSGYTDNSLLKKGDLIYKDMNGDNVIDSKDITLIDNTQSTVFGSINVDLRYKNFELYVLGNGVFGRTGQLSSYYKGGSGNNNYSMWVKDNEGGDYPRLSYTAVSHNTQTSSFWNRRTDFFKIQNVMLSYTVPTKVCERIGLTGIKVYVSGSNLFTLSGIEYTDPESMASGVTTYPLYSTYVGGLKLNF